MKKLLAIGLFAGMAATASAQVNNIKINPLSAIFRTINIQYERVLNEDMSVQLGMFGTFVSLGSDSAEVKFTGIGITPEYRYYVTKADAPKGFFVGPWLRYSTFAVEGKDEIDGNRAKVRLNQISGGLILGYQFLFGEVVTLDLFTGIGGGGGSSKVIEGDENDELDFRIFGSGVAYRAGIAIGVAFGD